MRKNMKNKIIQNIKRIGEFLSRKSYTGLIENLLESSDKWNETNYLKGYELSLYTNRALNKRAEKVGQIKWKLYKGEREIKEHQLLNLLYKPNKFFTGAEFWALAQKYKDIFGEYYIWVKSEGQIFEEKSVKELHLIRPDTIEMVFDEKVGITGYKKKGEKDVIYKPEEIIRSYYPNPANQLDAESLLTAGVKAIATEIQLAQYQSSILKNGGRVEGVFKFKTDKLNATQLSELKDKYKEQYADASRSGTPLFLGGESDYQSIGLKPDELAYLESKKMTLNDICIMTGVPKALLASVDDVKFDNADASERIFIKETIKPLLENLCTKINEFLVPKEFELEFEDPTPEDKQQARLDLETADKVYALTINEKREKLGLEPVKNGDVILVPFGLTPFGEERPNNNPPEDDEQDDKDDQQEDAKKNVKKFEHPLSDEYVRRKYWEFKIKKNDKRETEMIKHLDGYFKDQSKRIIEKLEVLRTYRHKGLIDDVWNPELEINLAKENFLPLLEKYLLEAGIESLKFSGSDFNFYVTGEIASWLDQKVRVFSEKINETTFKKLKREFERSLEENEDRKALINRIESTYGNISEGRAGTIARTEIQGVTGKGTYEGYRQAGIPIKIWVAVMDSHTRDSHAAVDGEEVPINQTFSNGLMYPGEVGAPAEEVVNCRCVI